MRGLIWTSAAQDMASRMERFCRDTYSDLADARQKRSGAPAAGKP